MNISNKVLNGRWIWGGSSCVLVFKANQDFVAADGEIVKAGEYRRVTCVIVDRDVTIPFIANIPSTTDSVSDTSGTYDTWFEQAGSRKIDWLLGFMLSHVPSSPISWESIFIFNDPPGFISGPTYGISFDQAALMIRQALYSVIVTRETPAGAVNGVNAIFTLTNVPILGSEEVFVNGILRENDGEDYSISGAVITMSTIPEEGDYVRVNYRHAA